MGEVTQIGWCHKTKSMWHGCTKVSDGCKNCYAARDAVRFPGRRGIWGPNGTRVVSANWQEYIAWNRKARSEGVAYRVFPSLCDPFEDFQGYMTDKHGNIFDATMGYIRRLWFEDVAMKTPSLRHLLLTKRPGNILPFWPVMESAGDIAPFPGMPGPLGQPLPAVRKAGMNNIWLGTSVENQEMADKRIPELVKCRSLSPVLWLSIEPLLGPIEFKSLKGIDWAIIGGESGPNHRECDPKWFDRIAEQCMDSGVKVFVKQDSGPNPGFKGRLSDHLWSLKEIPSDSVA